MLWCIGFPAAHHGPGNLPHAAPAVTETVEPLPMVHDILKSQMTKAPLPTTRPLPEPDRREAEVGENRPSKGKSGTQREVTVPYREWKAT